MKKIIIVLGLLAAIDVTLLGGRSFSFVDGQLRQTLGGASTTIGTVPALSIK